MFILRRIIKTTLPQKTAFVDSIGLFSSSCYYIFMRLFIAINFSPQTRSKIALVQNNLKAKSIKGNFTRIENIHLTLAFLGEIEPLEVENLINIIKTIKFDPFELEIDELGTFGRALWYCSVKQSHPLKTLQSNLNKLLKDNNFPTDDRPYKPHITIARNLILNDQIFKPFELIKERVTALSLMESIRINGKLTYIELFNLASC
jgi:2'-5' RNA ligase